MESNGRSGQRKIEIKRDTEKVKWKYKNSPCIHNLKILNETIAKMESRKGEGKTWHKVSKKVNILSIGILTTFPKLNCERD